MKGQKSYLLGLTINKIKDSKLKESLEKVGEGDTWEKYKVSLNDEEYIVLGLYVNDLSRDKSIQIRNMVQRLTRDGYINPLTIKGHERFSLMSSINPSYTNVGFPLTLINMRDFLYVLCMLDVEKVGILSGDSVKDRTPANRFESLLLNINN